MKWVKSLYKSTVIAGVAVLLFSFNGNGISKVLQAKIDKAVKDTYSIESFEMLEIHVPEELQAKVKTKLGPENIFRLENEGTAFGFLYLGQAPSKKKIFDYIVMFQPDLTVKKSKVLIYRENYGREIGSQRWLKQFIGLSPEDTIVYGKDIDAISGATISASSMTKAVGGVLEAVNLLTKEMLYN